MFTSYQWLVSFSQQRTFLWLLMLCCSMYIGKWDKLPVSEYTVKGSLFSALLVGFFLKRWPQSVGFMRLHLRFKHSLIHLDLWRNERNFANSAQGSTSCHKLPELNNANKHLEGPDFLLLCFNACKYALNLRKHSKAQFNFAGQDISVPWGISPSHAALKHQVFEDNCNWHGQ